MNPNKLDHQAVAIAPMLSVRRGIEAIDFYKAAQP